MPSSSSVPASMPREGVRRTGEETSLAPVTVRKGPKPAATATDGRVAAWFDAAVKCWGKGTAFADELGIGEAFLSEMRSGKRGVALRHLLPLLGHPEAVLAFVAPLLESIGYHARPIVGPTRAQVAEVAVRLLEDGRPTRDLLNRECERVHGWTVAQVEEALKGTK